MKQLFLVLLSFSVLISCKKEKSTAPESTPASTTPTPAATYQCNLKTNFILTNNLGVFDTSFTFNGVYLKTVGSVDTWAPFPSTNFNGYIANASNSFNSQIPGSPNFMQLAAHATWDITSSEFGNFQFIDTISMAKFATSTSTIPATFDAAQGIPINISGIENTDYANLDDKDDLYFPNYRIKAYNQNGMTSIHDTIRGMELSDIPVNATLTLSINLGKTQYETINGHNSYVLKWTTYYYNIKRIN